MEIKAGYKQTEIGVIPEDWDLRLFGEMASVRRQTYDSRKSGTHDFCIELEHIGQGTGTLLGVSETSIRSSMKRVFNKNDVLFGRLRAYLKKYWLSNRSGVASSEIWPLVANPDVTIPKYIFQIVQTNNFIEAASETYGTHMPRSDWNVIKTVRVPLPPTQAEQSAIAEALSDADALIVSLGKLIAKKKDIKQGAMQLLLTGKKRLPGFNGEWEAKTFEDVADKSVKWSITGGPFGSNLKASAYTSDGVRIIQLQNIGDGVFNDEYKIYTSKEKADELLSCNIYPGEIILSKMGDPVARACFIPNSDKRFLMSSDGIRLVINEKIFHKKYVHDYINSIYFRQYAIEASTGTTRQRIGLDELKKLPFICPPLPEQTAIAQVLFDMDAEIEELERKLSKYKLIKQGMMQELLTGKKRLI